MNSCFNRRDFIKLTGAGSVALALGSATGCATWGKGDAGARVAVIGGGPGGASAAKYLKLYEPQLEVTLIEPKRTYFTCFGGNWYLGGFRALETLGHDYQDLQDRYGIRMVHDRAVDIDYEQRQVVTAESGVVAYDKLVVSPGIGFDWERVEGMGPDDTRAVPHAYEGGEQYAILRSQLESMDDGGTVVVCPPTNPYRCPPGPYERASLIAHYLKEHKPRSKVLILDSKDKFSKQGLFTQGWNELYGDMIEWVPAGEGGRPERISVSDRTVVTASGAHRADVLNVIPPQQAGALAYRVDLVDDSGWCPVDQRTFRSTRHENVYVIGDSSTAGAMPKSGHSANTQGKAVAVAILAELRGHEMPEPSTVNTCYSLVSPDYGITVAAVYEYRNGQIRGVPGAGGLSPADAPRGFRQREAAYAPGWYAAITQDIFY